MPPQYSSHLLDEKNFMYENKIMLSNYNYETKIDIILQFVNV